MAAFVSQMNGLAQRVGMRNTRFTNPHGLGQSGQGGYSTAADVARLTIKGLRTPGLSFYSSQSERTLSVIRGGGPRPVLVRNTNELLGRAGVDGGKTGTTASAGPCLMATAPRPATVTKRPDGSTVVVPNRLVVVVLGANDRFNQAYTLLQQGGRRAVRRRPALPLALRLPEHSSFSFHPYFYNHHENRYPQQRRRLPGPERSHLRSGGGGEQAGLGGHWVP